ARAAEILRVRRATLSDLVNGKAALSPEMALRIEKASGVNMDMLLRMQVWHDANTMRRRAGEIHVKRYPPPSAEPRYRLDSLARPICRNEFSLWKSLAQGARQRWWQARHRCVVSALGHRISNAAWCRPRRRARGPMALASAAASGSTG